MACQYFRAMFAVPRIPQRQRAWDIDCFLIFDLLAVAPFHFFRYFCWGIHVVHERATFCIDRQVSASLTSGSTIDVAGVASHFDSATLIPLLGNAFVKLLIASIV